jgi:cell division protein FtsW
MGHLPYAYSDFILSVIAEEWGLIGVMFTVLLFGLFCWLGFRIAKTARDPFGAYLAAGITIAVGITALLHALVVLRMMPPTGLTLPFISAGRVSLVLYLFSAGVLMSIGRGRGRPARQT